MSVIGSNILAGASGQGGGYNLTNSLRFRSSASAYLNRTPASATNRKTWTWSGWVKRGALGSSQALFSCESAASNYSVLYFSSGNILQFYTNSGGTDYSEETVAVFRDPSAWYHVVFALDTTQATASERAKIYINGVQQTDGQAFGQIPQNNEPFINSLNQHAIGRDEDGGVNYFDGYLTEVNFIDGQALTPSSFGETNAKTGVWQPKKYAGTYGTNGFYLPFTSSQYGLSMFATTGTGFSTYAGSFVSGDPTGTQVNLPANSTNLAIGTGDFTVEGWVNTTVNGRGSFIGIGTANSAGSFSFFWEDNSTTYVRFGSTDVISTGLSLSSAGWVHLAVTRSGSTVRLYKNGSLVGSGTSSANLNLTDIASIGGYAKTEASSYTLQGSLSNVRLVVGTALYTGSTYTVPTSALTAVSGTQLLTLQNSTLKDNSANNYGLSAVQPFVLDASGNANNWQPNGINVTAVGATYDSMTDVPTLTSATASNFATLNPLMVGSYLTLSSANLTATGNTSANSGGSLATIGSSTGKWYFESTVESTTKSFIGVVTYWAGNMSYLIDENNLYGTSGSNKGIGIRGSGTTYGNASEKQSIASFTFSVGDVVGVAIDADNGAVYFSVNGSWLNSGSPTSGASRTGSFTNWTPSSDRICYPALSAFDGGVVYLNCGQRPFAYTPPTGFVALNTFNLPTPTIGATASTQANKYMNVVTRNGFGSSGGSIDLGFQPDFLWEKVRNSAQNHLLVDSVRGTTKELQSNTTNAETTGSSNYITGFTSTGVSFGSADWSTGTTLVDWAWKANGTGVSNTAGSITSTVSANTTSGFSVVTYTGNGTAGATVGHGLGVAPKMVIVKNRNSGGTYWGVYHTSIPASQAVYLNVTSAASTNTALWNSTAPTSSVFSVGTSSDSNENGWTYVAYCFSEVAGYSRFGSYTGNGSSTAGPFVYTGFKPKYVVIKCTSAAGQNWVCFDTSRSPYNLAQNVLYPNLSNAEGTGTTDNIDFLSNGFRVLGTSGGSINQSQTYIYMAFAEVPTKFSLAQ